jgi:hypothetical protein
MYKVIGNKAASDVIAENNVEIGSGLELEEARRVAIAAQMFEGYICAWVEPEAPEITRTIESNFKGKRHRVTRCDGWMV